jgi:cobalt transporter subunit CbtB
MERLQAAANVLATEHRVTAVVPAILAALLGLFILWGVGFAGPSVIHNAAHDTRHSVYFPCH